MLRKIAIGLIAVAVAWLGGRALVWALASDETQIRWKLEDACEAFGETRMQPILDFLARDFVDEMSGYQRDDVRAAVASVFFTAKDPQTKKFPYRAEVVEGTLAIAMDPAAEDRATLKGTILVTDTTGGGERKAWEFQLNGELVDGDDGWQLVRTTHDTSEGNWKLR